MTEAVPVIEGSQTNPGVAVHGEAGSEPAAGAPPSHPPPPFPRLPGETPRAYSAFTAFFNLGSARSLQAAADQTGEGLDTVKQWSAKFGWTNRLHAFNTSLLNEQARDLAGRQLKQAADWAARLDRFREQEWDAAQKLLSAAQCFLESFGDDDLGKMTLAQVSRALSVSSAIGRSALAGAELPASSEPAMSPVQQQMLAAIARVYGQASPPDSRAASSTSPSTPTAG